MIHTFVICAYQESEFLENAILSVLKQISVEKKFSTVICYTSTPNAHIENLCGKHQIKLFTGTGGSIGKDWNHALACVETSYATIVHQDDIYDDSYGDEIVATFEKHPDANLVFSDYYEVDKNGVKRPRNINLKIKTLGLHIMNLSKNKTYQRRIYAFGDFISCPAVSFNMERLKSFKFSEKMRQAVDWDAWERIMKLPGNIYYIPKRLMGHRIHSDSETTKNTNNAIARESEEYQMFRRYWGKRMASLLMRVYKNNQKSNQV